MGEIRQRDKHVIMIDQPLSHHLCFTSMWPGKATVHAKQVLSLELLSLCLHIACLQFEPATSKPITVKGREHQLADHNII